MIRKRKRVGYLDLSIYLEEQYDFTAVLLQSERDAPALYAAVHENTASQDSIHVMVINKSKLVVAFYHVQASEETSCMISKFSDRS